MKDDTISRQAAIETVKKHYRVDNDLLEVIAYEIEALPPAQLAQDLPNGCTDTISREAAIETVRKAKSIGQAHRMLVQLPSAQPEIIRCKDCKYNPNPPECGNAACVLFYGMTDQMGFCHHGERREQE